MSLVDTRPIRATERSTSPRTRFTSRCRLALLVAIRSSVSVDTWACTEVGTTAAALSHHGSGGGPGTFPGHVGESARQLQVAAQTVDHHGRLRLIVPPRERAGGLAGDATSRAPDGAAVASLRDGSRDAPTPHRGGPPVMATLDECRQALERLADKLQDVDEDELKRHAFDRTLSCRVPDLDVTFTGRLEDGHIQDISTGDAERAQIRLTADSDDLVAMTDGHLGFGQAWLSGKVKVEAGVRDLLRLRSMLVASAVTSRRRSGPVPGRCPAGRPRRPTTPRTGPAARRPGHRRRSPSPRLRPPARSSRRSAQPAPSASTPGCGCSSPDSRSAAR